MPSGRALSKLIFMIIKNNVQQTTGFTRCRYSLQRQYSTLQAKKSSKNFLNYHSGGKYDLDKESILCYFYPVVSSI